MLLRGSTPLQGGRMRLILDGVTGARVGATGTIRVELTRPGLPTLADQRSFEVVETPPVRPADQQITLPPFRWQEVEGPDDQRWTDLGWPDDSGEVASSAELEEDTLV